MSDRPTEAGHWYTRDGETAYTMKGKNGQERPTTLRDARKLGLLPSVTMILNGAAKPGLDYWKQTQAIWAALTLPRKEGEPDEAFVERVRTDSEERARQARERGTLVHAWIQKGFEGEDVGEEGLPFFLAAQEEIWRVYGDVSWICEKSFAWNDKYGGKVDLHAPGWDVIDIKTSDKPLEDLKTWPEQWMQLAAYREGLGLYREGAILYVHSQVPKARLIVVTDEELEKGWRMFKALLDYWYAKNGMEGA